MFQMQTVDICNSSISDLYCPICGTHTLQPDGDRPTPCEHLVYVTCSETPYDPWFEREDLGLETPEDYEPEDLDLEMPEDDKSIPQALADRFPGGEYLLFLLSAPPPSGLEVYVMYTYRPSAER
jgi:hypothetical protein